MIDRRGFLVAAASAAVSAPAFALGEPGRTARSAALHRAAHQIIDAPPVFVDPYALPILGPDAEKEISNSLERRQRAGSRFMRAFIVARSQYAEDELARGLASGIRQYVVLGAGLDTFAYRNPHGAELSVFEIDHPATQAWKQQTLQKFGISVPPNVKYVAVDFEHELLGAKLAASGFRRDVPTFVSWLGVTMYLTKNAVNDTLRTLSETCAKGSRLVFDYAVPNEMLSEREQRSRERRAARVESIGEPWIGFFRPDELSDEMQARGFRDVVTIDADALNQRYFRNRQDGLKISGTSGRILDAQL
jgi:methyltransferase (TIGR00027 family)